MNLCDERHNSGNGSGLLQLTTVLWTYVSAEGDCQLWLQTDRLHWWTGVPAWWDHTRAEQERPKLVDGWNCPGQSTCVSWTLPNDLCFSIHWLIFILLTQHFLMYYIGLHQTAFQLFAQIPPKIFGCNQSRSRIFAVKIFILLYNLYFVVAAQRFLCSPIRTILLAVILKISHVIKQ